MAIKNLHLVQRSKQKWRVQSACSSEPTATISLTQIEQGSWSREEKSWITDEFNDRIFGGSVFGWLRRELPRQYCAKHLKQAAFVTDWHHARTLEADMRTLKIRLRALRDSDIHALLSTKTRLVHALLNALTWIISPPYSPDYIPALTHFGRVRKLHFLGGNEVEVLQNSTQ